MNAIGPISGELIAPGVGITIVAALHPFKIEHERFEADAGLTIADLVEIARTRATTKIRCKMRVALGHDVIGEELWHRVRPKPGTIVLMRAVPEGDAGNILKTVLTLAVIAAGVFLAAPLVGALGLAGLTVFGVSVVPLVGAAITIGGQLLVNALFPVAPPQLASDNSGSPTYSLSGGQNQAIPWGVVPMNLGQNRSYPPLGAKSYTEFAGADQYLRMLFIWGYGVQDIGQIKIGETPITDFDDVQVETRQGYITDLPVTLYPSEVLEDDFSIELTAAAGWQTRTTDTAIEEISLDVIAPSGLMRIDSSGAKNNYTVNIRAEYSPTGLGTWSLLGVLNLTARSTDAIRQNLRLAVASGQYDVRVEKTGSDYSGSDTVQETVVWTALRGFRNTPPIAFSKPLAITAIRIKATSQLNGTVDQLNAIISSHVLLAFNGATWDADKPSRNPADLFRFVLQCSANAKPVADVGIDIATLELWWQYCKDNNFNFDMIRDASGSVYDALGDIAAAGRAVQVFRDGLWSVVWDDPTSPIVQHFTTRNSNGFSGARSYNHLPHAFRVQFVNASNSYAQDERIVYDDGYDITNATLFEQVEFPGVTDPGIIWRMGRFHIAQTRLRPEIYTLNVDIEHIVCTRGDRVLVTHDVPEWGMMSGRVSDVSGQTITIDEPVTMDAITSYVIRFRLADGSTLLRNVINNDGERTVLVLNGTGAVPAIGDLWMFGVLNAESVVLRVRSVTPADDTSAKLTFVDDAPAISSADSGTIPPFNSQITAPVDLYAKAPINLKFLETFAGVDGGVEYGANISWETEAGQFPASFDVQYSDDVDGIWKDGPSVTAPLKTAFVAGLAAGTWSFRVRSVFQSGFASNWGTLAHQVIVGAGFPLGNITNLRAYFEAGVMKVFWDEIIDFRPVEYEIRKGSSWNAALFVVRQAHPPFIAFGDDTFWVSAVSQPVPGVTVYSATPSSIVITGALLSQNIVRSYDEQALGWGGIMSNGVATQGVNPTAFLRLGGAGNILTDADVLNTPDVLNYGGVIASGTYEIDPTHWVDVGYVGECLIGATCVGTGGPVGQDILSVTDFLNLPDVLGGMSAVFVDVHAEIAIAQSDSNDVFALPDAFNTGDPSNDVFAGSTSFSPWQKFVPGVYVGQVFKFRVVLTTFDGQTIAYCLGFSFQVTVPARTDNYMQQAVPNTGLTITFKPDGATAAGAFNGGPNGHNLPAVSVDGQFQTGDTYQITGLSLSQLTITFYDNTNTAVARTADIHVQGY